MCSCEKKIERNNQRKREGAVRGSTKVEEEAALREAAPTRAGVVGKKKTMGKNDLKEVLSLPSFFFF